MSTSPNPSAPEAARLVSGPANALIICSIVWIVALLVGIVFSTFLLVSGVAETLPAPAIMDKRTQVTVRLVIAVVLLCVNVLTLVGARSMKRLESRSMAMTAAILSVIPCTSACYSIGVPFGVWALVVLSKPELRGVFRS